METAEQPGKPAPAPTPGHPDGCNCAECDNRRAHVAGEPGHGPCIGHLLCLICDGCEPCEIETQRDREIGDLAGQVPGLVNEAQRAVTKARAAVDRLTHELYDIELAESPDGADALAELDEILRRLRHVQRIATARAALEATDARA